MRNRYDIAFRWRAIQGRLNVFDRCARNLALLEGVEVFRELNFDVAAAGERIRRDKVDLIVRHHGELIGVWCDSHVGQSTLSHVQDRETLRELVDIVVLGCRGHHIDCEGDCRL